MFRMHIGSVLSGLGIINVNTDLKMLSLPVFWGRKCLGVKNDESFFDVWTPCRGFL